MISDRVRDEIIRLKDTAEYIEESCLDILVRLDAGTEGLQTDIWNAHVLDGFITTLEDMGAQLDEWSGMNDEEDEQKQNRKHGAERTAPRFCFPKLKNELEVFKRWQAGA